jgi:hypothetical protein
MDEVTRYPHPIFGVCLETLEEPTVPRKIECYKGYDASRKVGPIRKVSAAMRNTQEETPFDAFEDFAVLRMIGPG